MKSSEEMGFQRFYARAGKRVFDLMLTIPALLFLLPGLLLTALLVRLDSAGPIFFLQERLGRNGTVFRLYKFRSMTDTPRTANREIIGRDAEVTRIGFWIRRFKIDELPQFWNVLIGDLSIVGPRPALPAQLAEYDDLARRRLLVRPGLTGLAQVHGNIHLSWAERWLYDARYVERMSLPLDLWIIGRTVLVILKGEEKFLSPLKDETPQ
ncbi:MAG TPA: sugar transferase [Abditibacteriaceae bacterium]|jgi:lipopolysaccharide/colanic/teichoic acid biosynthesis glycosyltransferase